MHAASIKKKAQRKASAPPITMHTIMPAANTKPIAV